MNKKIIVMIFGILFIVSVISCKLFFRSDKDMQDVKVENPNEVNKELNETKKHIINLIQKKAKDLGYIDSNNLKSFEINRYLGIWIFRLERKFKICTSEFQF